MLSVTEAQALILEAVPPRPAEMVPLTPAALGLVLAEDVVSDIDSPPYDKALMDGYAVRSTDLATALPLGVIEEITAGRTPQKTVGPGQTSRIMTGAPLPPGADAVVAVERTRLLEDGRVRVGARNVQPGRNVLPQGREMRRGETVLQAGAVLRPQEFGLLATVGRTTVRAVPAPHIAVLSTGDEVVDASQVPGPGQIRNGNGPMLVAQAARAGAVPRFLGIARDDVGDLRSRIVAGLEGDALVLSGGVSAGKLDLVPGVLQEMGVDAHFHKVEMKPGKPMFFGSRPRRDGGKADTNVCPTVFVFGLPGNPVSALVCFELFVRPAVRALRGEAEPGPRWLSAELTEDYPYRTERPTYHPALLSADEGGWRVRIVPWFGSPDLRALTKANALVLLPVGDHHHRAGEELPVLWTDGL